MIKTVIFVTTIAMSSLSFVFAQEQQVQPEEPSVAALVDGVSASAGRLQDALDRFRGIMADAPTKDSGMKALDEMLDAARNVNESLNEDSEIWNELQALIEDWSKKRDSVLERSRTNPGLQPLAALWQERLDRVVELRKDILDQSTDTGILIEDIENKKEIIAEYYDLDTIDQVLAEMQVMSDELGRIVAGMEKIRAQTVGLDEDQVPATN